MDEFTQERLSGLEVGFPLMLVTNDALREGYVPARFHLGLFEDLGYYTAHKSRTSPGDSFGKLRLVLDPMYSLRPFEDFAGVRIPVIQKISDTSSSGLRVVDKIERVYFGWSKIAEVLKSTRGFGDYAEIFGRNLRT